MLARGERILDSLFMAAGEPCDYRRSGVQIATGIPAKLGDTNFTAIPPVFLTSDTSLFSIVFSRMLASIRAYKSGMCKVYQGYLPNFFLGSFFLALENFSSRP